MKEIKKRGAPKGNKNRLGKTLENTATSFLHIRCTPQDKARWVKASKNDGKLSVWVTKTLNDEADLVDYLGEL